MEEIPTIFLPLNLRSGSKFRSLKHYCFCSEEKLWVCMHLVSSCEELDRDLASDVQVFCDKYSLKYPLKYSLITAWINQYADGVSFSDIVCPIDGDRIQAILGIVAVGSRSGESKAEYQKILYTSFINERSRTSFNRGYT